MVFVPICLHLYQITSTRHLSEYGAPNSNVAVVWSPQPPPQYQKKISVQTFGAAYYPAFTVVICYFSSLQDTKVKLFWRHFLRRVCNQYRQFDSTYVSCYPVIRPFAVQVKCTDVRTYLALRWACICLLPHLPIGGKQNIVGIRGSHLDFFLKGDGQKIEIQYIYPVCRQIVGAEWILSAKKHTTHKQNTTPLLANTPILITQWLFDRLLQKNNWREIMSLCTFRIWIISS